MIITKEIYKIELYTLKVIPMVISAIYLLNTILSYYYIDLPILSWIGGLSLLPWLFLYLSSFVFRFCIYHRMFLYYIVACNILSYIDYTWTLPISDRGLFLLNTIIAGIFLFVILYLKLKVCKHSRKS